MRCTVEAATLCALALALALCAGCTPTSANGEFGALCWDGKDNDGDGAADCDDSECASLSICRRTNIADVGTIRPDFGVGDRGFPVDDAGTQDATVDGQPPTTTSSYGMPCTWRGTVTTCPDGKTSCVLSPTSNTQGYCTFTCSSTPDNCPQPTDTRLSARCLYRFNNVSVCTFMCKLFDLSWTCPDGLGCYTLSGTQQSHCWLK
ncbi:MAG: hypothetical protein KC503_40115 [Myxococcales bacterium]|nr:hypothetical protein [Myxococcales bacterium]